MAEYIEREAALSEIDKAFKMFQEHDDIVELYSDARAAIIYAKQADVAPVRHGRWFPTAKWWQGGSAWKQCSECGILHLGKSNFCPNCGCKMDLEG